MRLWVDFTFEEEQYVHVHAELWQVNFFSQNSIYTLQKIGKQLVIDFTTKERERGCAIASG